MTAAAFAADLPRRDGRPRAFLRAVVVLGGLGLAVGLRWQIFRTAAVDGVSEGLVFGAALLAVAATAGGLRPSRPRAQVLMSGVVAGGLLVAISAASRWPVLPMTLGHAAPFAPWMLVTSLVATAEELVLRGSLWHWAAESAGDVVALLLTSLLFALIHVPVYGWSVVPLDVGVGLIFGGLRLWFGGPAAPAAAHVIADLATWWI
jgi:membrane protease YdiL (CAAX protease family)